MTSVEEGKLPLPVIAIDGPGGAGKSTVAAAVARRLGLARLDTGSMYRAVALATIRAGVDPSDGAGAGGVAARSSIEPGERVLLDGEDVTVAIRSPAVDGVVSIVAAHPQVRAVLLPQQRAWADRNGGGVMEGRDIGTVVLPGADVKVYLTAEAGERARRRARERDGQTDGGEAADGVWEPDREGDGLEGDEAAVARQIATRDALDSGRSHSPLVPAPDAVVIDSTRRSVGEIVDEVCKLL